MRFFVVIALILSAFSFSGWLIYKAATSEPIILDGTVIEKEFVPEHYESNTSCNMVLINGNFSTMCMPVTDFVKDSDTIKIKPDGDEYKSNKVDVSKSFYDDIEIGDRFTYQKQFFLTQHDLSKLDQ